MFKVAILGCENSHANQFLKLVIKDKEYTDIEFVGVYSDDTEAANKLAEEFGVYVMQSYDEFVGKVDGIIITARHGDNHLKYAKPYFESGIPMFVDKPITCTEADALELKALAAKHNVRLCGGSVLKFPAQLQKLKKAVAEKTYGNLYGAVLRAPVNLKNEYGDFYFYSQHLVAMMCELFGFYPNSVIAHELNGTVNCTVRYDACDVNLIYTSESYDYYASISCKDGFPIEKLSLEGCFMQEFEEFYDLLLGKPQPESTEDFIAPVFIINALDRALKSGKEEQVNRQ